MNLQRLTYVEPILFGYMFAAIVLAASNDQLIYRKVCLSKFNGTYCDTLDESRNESYKHDQSTIQQDTSFWMRKISLASKLPAVFPAILYASWSDKLGRKSIMWLPLVGDLLSYIGYILNAYYMSASVLYILLLEAVTSLGGGFTCLIAVSFSYVSDMSERANRSSRIVILESMLALAGIAGGLSSGYIIKYFGYLISYSVMSIVIVIVLLYTLFLKESHVPDKKATLSDLLSFHYVRDACTVYFRRRTERYRSTLLLLLVCFLISVGLLFGIGNIFILYAKHSPRNMDSAQIGILIAESYGLNFVGSLLLMTLLTRILNWSDYSVIILGILSYIATVLGTSFASSATLLYLAYLPSIANGLFVPYMRSSMSKLVNDDEKGKLFAVIASLEMLISLAVSMSAYTIYAKTEPITPAFFYFVLAGLAVIPLSMTIYLKYYGQVPSYTPLVTNVDVGEEREALVS